ncbi:hypothetical protein OPQ81_011303 [Rhizoctonia solani]|nr:hypothetical protein OPQ81_011303 [Rhizoctonia solani]
MTTVDLLALAAQPTRPFESIPIIDISGLSGDPDSRAQVASDILEACIHVGFFYVKNHGVNQSTIASAADASRRFFALSSEEKMKVDYHKTPNTRGYYPVIGNRYRHECFEVGLEVDASSNNSPNVPNLWPSEDVVSGLREAALKYYQEVVELGHKLWPTFALALNLPENYFDDKLQTTGPRLRLLHYLQQSVVDEKNPGPGIGAHSEYVFFTILWQDQNPALQVKNTSGQWINAPPIPGTFIVNIGDQLSRWTNGIFKSTVHRVFNNSGAERYSMPLFFGLDSNVKIEALPSCVSESRPARYESILAGDFVRGRHAYYHPEKQ